MINQKKMHVLDKWFDDIFAAHKPYRFAANVGKIATIGAIDVSEDDKNVYIELDVPSFAIDEIKIEVDNNKIAISGEKQEETNDRRYKIKERSNKSFYRSVTLENNIDADAVEAELVDGVLMIEIAKINPESQKKKIQIKKN